MCARYIIYIGRRDERRFCGGKAMNRESVRVKNVFSKKKSFIKRSTDSTKLFCFFNTPKYFIYNFSVFEE